MLCRQYILEYRNACTIQLEEVVIVTGGDVTPTQATAYNSDGFLADLPTFNVPRRAHGCGHFINTDNKAVLYYYYEEHDHITMSNVICSGVPCGRRQHCLHRGIGGWSSILDGGCIPPLLHVLSTGRLNRQLYHLYR